MLTRRNRSQRRRIIFFLSFLSVILLALWQISLGIYLSSTSSSSNKKRKKTNQRKSKTATLTSPQRRKPRPKLKQAKQFNQEEKEVSKKSIHYLHFGKHITNDVDYFSATWLQSTPRFLYADTNVIEGVEEASFVMFSGREQHVLMTLDWLDFSVEHMSKWWKLHEDYDTAIEKLDAYTDRTMQQSTQSKELEDTIALIAFMAFDEDLNVDHDEEISDKLTIASLSATLASLYHVGFGRVLVVGRSNGDSNLVQKSFQHLSAFLIQNKSTQGKIETIGQMEVSFVLTYEREYKTPWIDVNMPKAAVEGLQNAFKGKFSKKQQQLWLGKTHGIFKWKYVYLTEPDTILHAKNLQSLKEKLNQGYVLAPHRFQPIPHEDDFSYQNQQLLLSAQHNSNFSKIIKLSHDSYCCDVGNIKPGLPPHYEQCKNFWWLCGFNRYDIENITKWHKHFTPYSFIKLEKGMNVVTLAGSEHGRPCKPSPKECQDYF